MAKHVHPELGEITYFICPLGRVFPRWIPTPRWLDTILMDMTYTRFHRVPRWLNTHWIVRSRTVLYD